VTDLVRFLTSLRQQVGELPEGEKALVDYLVQLPAKRWDVDCEVVALYILDRYRTRIPDIGLRLPPVETDLVALASAAERIRQRAERWARGSFTKQVVAILDSEGGTQVVVVVLPWFHQRFIEELRSIDGYRYVNAFKQHKKATLYPITSATQVVRWCRRRHITPSPELERLAGPVGEQLDVELDVTLVEDGTRLRVSFAYNPRAVAEIKQIPGRRFDPITKDAWSVPVEQLPAVLAFADDWGLAYAEDLPEQVQASRGVS
jgi:hypothetical protein